MFSLASCSQLELGFMLRSAQNCKQSIFLANLSSITPKRNMETTQLTSFFKSTFPALIASFNFVFVGTPLLSIAVCKIPQFWAKATNSDNPSYFSRKETMRLLKNHIIFLPLGEPTKRYQFMVYYGLIEYLD